MAHSKIIRNFIILQEDEKDQSIAKDKSLSGYAKIEAKADRCKISFYAQNIRKDENKCYMAIVCCRKDIKQTINIGVLNIGTQGKCDTAVEFSAADIASFGFDVGNIVGAAVFKEIQGKIVYLMYGFINGQLPKDDWKKYKKIKYKKALEGIVYKDVEVEEVKECKDKKDVECKKCEDIKKETKECEACKEVKEEVIEEIVENKKCDDKKEECKEEPKEECKEEYIDDCYEEHHHEKHHHDDHHHEEHHDDHHDDKKEDKDCCINRVEDKTEELKEESSVIIEQPINIQSLDIDDNLKNALRSDSIDKINKEGVGTIKDLEVDKKAYNNPTISGTIEDELLRNMKIKAIEQELEEFKNKICEINKNNQEAIVNELNKFKDLCTCQMKNLLDVLSLNQKNSSDDKKRDDAFEEYEKKIEDAKKYRFINDNMYELKGKVGEYFNGIMKDYYRDNESIKDINNCIWYDVPVNNIQEMCDKDQKDKNGVVYHLMINNYPYIINSGHFLFGIKGDKDGNAEYLVYAVPGTDSVKDQPYGGKSGFVTWVRDMKNRGNTGYWLMFYDFKNQILVAPIKD